MPETPALEAYRGPHEASEAEGGAWGAPGGSTDTTVPPALREASQSIPGGKQLLAPVSGTHAAGKRGGGGFDPVGCPCGLPSAGGHHFGWDLRCDYCGMPYEEAMAERVSCQG